MLARETERAGTGGEKGIRAQGGRVEEGTSPNERREGNGSA